MKKLILCAVALSLTAATFGQIKMADSSFETQLEKLDVLNQPFSVKDILPPFDGTDFGERLFRGAVYPIGERIMMLGKDEDGDGFSDEMTRTDEATGNVYHYHPILKINHEKRTAEMAPMRLRAYYTITGLILGTEGRDSLKQMVVDYIGEDSVRRTPIGNSPGRATGIYYEPEIYRFFQTRHPSLEEYMKEKRMFHNYICYYVLEDDDNNEYYINNYVGGRIALLSPLSVSFYENLKKLLVNRKVALFKSYGRDNYIYDAYTGKQLTNLQLSYGYPNDVREAGLHFDYTCTDIILKGNNLLAVLENSDSKFTQSILKIDTDYAFKSVKCDNGVILLSKSEWDRVVAERAKNAQQRQAAREKEMAESRARLKAEREQYRQELIAKYGATYGEQIFNNKVALGMTLEMCRRAWGNPIRRATIQTTSGTKVVWTYYNVKLYFLHDKLIEIVRY